jgi:hypothetical protein
MKKFYLSPEIEVVLIEPTVLSAASPDPDTTDPIPVIDDPSDDDLKW